MTIDIERWKEVDLASWQHRVPSGLSLVDRLPEDWINGLEPLQALALAYSPEATLRPDQMRPSGDFQTWIVMPARGWGKTHVCASNVVQEILTADRQTDIALIAPTLPEVTTLQWEAIKKLIPPWVRYVPRKSDDQVDFPDHGPSSLLFRSAQVTEFRGPNLRMAWGDESLKWPRGEELYRNVKLALRVPGPRPPLFMLSTTPPLEPNWILQIATEPGTYLTRGTTRDNYKLDKQSIDGLYAAMAGTAAGERELEGKVLLTVEGALFHKEDLDQFRVFEAPKLERVVVCVDPTQTGGQYSDTVGIIVLGIRDGHLYVLRSKIERMATDVWAPLAIEYAAEANAQAFVAESTGVGSVGFSLRASMALAGMSGRWPIELADAHGDKARRADALSILSRRGRLHIVGHQAALESELTTWTPNQTGKRWSPGGLDALVHGARYLTQQYRGVDPGAGMGTEVMAAKLREALRSHQRSRSI